MSSIGLAHMRNAGHLGSGMHMHMHPSMGGLPPQRGAGYHQDPGLHPQQQQRQRDNMEVLQKAVALLGGDRERALSELSKSRDRYPDLAVILWYLPGVMTVLVSEVITVYDKLNATDLTGPASNRVCNALALWQSVVNHKDTRPLCIRANLPLFLFPLLNTSATTRPMEYLRLTSLGVIGALVKSDDASVVTFLLKTELIPLCLRIMETGTELSRTVATFIVLRIIQTDNGLNYVCATPERFFAVAQVLAKMTDAPPLRLLKNVVRCYLRLSEHPKARDALLRCLPDALRNGTFNGFFEEDMDLKRWLVQLLLNIGETNTTALHQTSTPAASTQGQSTAPTSSASASASSGQSTPTGAQAQVERGPLLRGIQVAFNIPEEQGPRGV